MELPVLISPPPGGFRATTVSDADAIIDAARKVGSSPLFEDWVREVEEFRRLNNTVPDADPAPR